jgi:hypothetical protein
MVPYHFRADWRRHHEEEIEDWAVLVDRGDIAPRCRPIINFVLAVAATTVRQRVRFERNQANAERLVRTPRFALGLVLGAATLVAVLSGGFHGTRSMLARLPYPDADRVVEFRAFVPFLGARNEIPAETLDFWRKGSQTIEAFAGYSIDGKIARVSPEFFQVLGIHPASGRLFGAGDQPGCCTVVREGTSSSHATGTLPRAFWFRSRVVNQWIPLGADEDAYVIARLKPGISAEAAQHELRTLAREGIVRPLLHQVQATRVELRTLNDAFRYPLYLASGGLAVSLGILGGYAAVSAWTSRPRAGWRYWLFLLAKTAGTMVVTAAAWVEMTAAWQVVITRLGGPTLNLIFNWTFLLVSVGAIWQAQRDQRRRCPVCLNRLTLPVFIGSWASPLMDPVSTELVCEAGHGTLSVPETQSSDREPERWRPLDASWRDTFRLNDNAA